MSREKRSARTTAPPVDSHVLTFVSHAEQLHLRGQRNYDRYMLFTKGFVKADGPERREWQKESDEDSVRDADWNQRHGPIPGGAVVRPLLKKQTVDASYNQSLTRGQATQLTHMHRDRLS
jgi:hypothetical protein